MDAAEAAVPAVRGRVPEDVLARFEQWGAAGVVKRTLRCYCTYVRMLITDGLPGLRDGLPLSNPAVLVAVSSLSSRSERSHFGAALRKFLAFLQIAVVQPGPDEDEYEVEKILEESNAHGKTELLIKWKGFRDDHNSWEPEEHLDCADLLREFRREALAVVPQSAGSAAAASAAGSSTEDEDLVHVTCYRCNDDYSNADLDMSVQQAEQLGARRCDFCRGTHERTEDVDEEEEEDAEDQPEEEAEDEEEEEEEEDSDDGEEWADEKYIPFVKGFVKHRDSTTDVGGIEYKAYVRKSGRRNGEKHIWLPAEMLLADDATNQLVYQYASRKTRAAGTGVGAHSGVSNNAPADVPPELWSGNDATAPPAKEHADQAEAAAAVPLRGEHEEEPDDCAAPGMSKLLKDLVALHNGAQRDDDDEKFKARWTTTLWNRLLSEGWSGAATWQNDCVFPPNMTPQNSTEFREYTSSPPQLDYQGCF